MNKNSVLISVLGKNPYIFLRRLIINNVKYDKLKEINYNNVVLKISYEDYLKIKEFKSIYIIKIIKYYGFIKYLYLIKKNISFLVSLIISVLLLFILSNICFDIKIVHNDKKIRNLVSDELEEYGIKKYKIIPNFTNRRKIVEKIIKENKNVIEWMEIEKKGCKLIIKITQRKLNDENKNNPLRHAVAKKNGIIKKIKAENGIILKKVDDYVSKGDIIVSSNIMKDDVIKGQVSVNAEIYAEVWYTVNVSYPLYYEEIKYLNEIKNNYVITFFDKNYYIKKNYDSLYSETKKTIIKDNLFPFSISKERQRKTKVIKEKLTDKQAILKASEKAEEKILCQLEKNEYIISKKILNFIQKESKIEVDIFFKVYENITDYVNVEENITDNQG